jgi:hypothetical protein
MSRVLRVHLFVLAWHQLLAVFPLLLLLLAVLRSLLLLPMLPLLIFHFPMLIWLLGPLMQNPMAATQIEDAQALCA